MRLLLPLVACVLAAGCTAAVEGTPATATAVPPPPRPREVRLDGVNPCSLLTPEQRAGLGLTSEPQASRPRVELFRGDVPTCTIRGPYPEAALLVSGAVTTVGVERWSQSDIAASVRPTTVAGFPAVVAVPTRFRDYCNVEVDVAPGQLLDVQYGAGGPQASVPQEQLCTRAAESAEMMMSALLHR